MKAICPNNPEHREFWTTASELTEWVVDEEGNFVRAGCCLEVVHGPDPENEWTCAVCGAKAKVTP